ncbi:hypothetical protein [Chromobacterium sp.]
MYTWYMSIRSGFQRRIADAQQTLNRLLQPDIGRMRFIALAVKISG